ncbi:MAG: methyltransferase domain-containing protein [Armatimonadota bacterium]
MSLDRKTYRWFYDRVACRCYDLMIRWCFFPLGGEKRIRRQLLEPISFHPEEKVLDIGCGTGGATFAIAERAGATAQIVGVDLSHGQIRRAVGKNRSAKVCFLVADATGTCFPDGAFDKVFVTHMIHEMPRAGRLALLREARRLLRDGGEVIVLELDNPESLPLRAFTWLWWFYWLPFNFETPTRKDMLRRGLAEEVREAGFGEVRKGSYARGAFQVVRGRK